MTEATRAHALAQVRAGLPGLAHLEANLHGQLLTSLLAYLAEVQLAAAPASERRLLHLWGLEGSLLAAPQTDGTVAMSRLLDEVNMHREPLFRELSFTTLLWLSPWAARQLRQHAPDFWDWVSYPLESFFYWGFGNDYLAVRQYDQAVAQFQKALALGVTDHDYYAQMGEAQRLANRWPEALAALQQAKAQAEAELAAGQRVGFIDLGEVDLSLARLHAQQQRWGQALEQALAALTWYQQPGRDRLAAAQGQGLVHQFLAEVYEDMGRLGSAAPQVAPDYAARTLAHYQQAVKHLRMAAQTGEVAEIYYQMGALGQTQHDWGQAIRYYQRAAQENARLANWEDAALACQQMAACFHQLGQPEQAAAAQDQAQQWLARASH
ncbi:MAG: soluble NSF attachment family protein [Bernardetiaceae bacterium]|nr:soluble NSF attachment family protein [Bernardetiaceae bacterium]